MCFSTGSNVSKPGQCEIDDPFETVVIKCIAGSDDLLCPEVLDGKVLLKTIHGMYLAISEDGKVEAGPRRLSTDAELTFENANEGSVEKIKAFTNSVKKENKHCSS